ncbi:hypothetical protein B7486_57225, partial [cyanobacterium TDX16]
MPDDLLDRPLDDLVGLPDLDQAWTRTHRRARRRQNVRRGVAWLALVALLVGAGIGVVVSRSAETDETRVVTQPEAEEGPLESGWHELPSAPLQPPNTAAWEPAMAVMDRALFVWGGSLPGSQSGSPDGAVLDLDSGAWAEVSEEGAPGRLHEHAHAIWTGDVVLLTGAGWIEEEQELYTWDPSHDRWSVATQVPTLCRTSPQAWSGTELHFVCGRGEEPLTLQAYDPARDTWRVLPPLPDEPTDPILVWSDDRLTVLGLEAAGIERTIAAQLEPTADRWQTIDPPPALADGGATFTNVHRTTWTGTNLVLLAGASTPSGAG